jgi:hypothetical protein
LYDNSVLFKDFLVKHILPIDFDVKSNVK